MGQYYADVGFSTLLQCKIFLEQAMWPVRCWHFPTLTGHMLPVMPMSY